MTSYFGMKLYSKWNHLKQVYLTKLTDDARKTSAINKLTKTIIIEESTCDPEVKEKSRRYWLSLTGTHCFINIADKFDVMYNRPVTDRVVNFAQQLLKRIPFQVNDLQDCCYVPVEKKTVVHHLSWSRHLNWSWHLFRSCTASKLVLIGFYYGALCRL